jgi:hypothetical protein
MRPKFRIPSRPPLVARGPVASPVLTAIAGAAVMPADAQRRLVGPGFEALADLRSGRGSVAAWQQLADRLNLAEALCELRIANNLADTVQSAHAALAAVIQRAQAGRGWTLFGPEVKALDDALWIYQTQLSLCSLREHQRAEDIARNRISQALAGNASARAVVHDSRTLR